MKTKERAIPATKDDAPADRAAFQALEAGELRRLEYVASLHPREREALDPR
jgi:hypothetical protein